MNEESFSPLNYHVELAMQLAAMKNQQIAEVFAAAGLEHPVAVALSGRLTILVAEGDPFEHYYLDYGKPQEKRIISFERMPEIKTVEDGTVFKMVAEARYY